MRMTYGSNRGTRRRPAAATRIKTRPSTRTANASGHKLDAATRRFVLRAWSNGIGFRAIGRAVGVRPSTVRWHVRRAGVAR